MTVLSSKLHVDIAGDGPVVLYLHGLGDSGTLPPALAESLPDRTWVRPSHPGFPESSAVEASSIREVGGIYADFLRNFLAEHEEQTCTVLGASLGGWVAAELLLQAPELLEEVILLSPAGLDDELISPPILEMNGAEVLNLASLPRSDAEEFSLPSQVIERMKANLLAAQGLIVGPRLSEPGLATRLATSTAGTPVTIYWGAHDAIIPRGIIREWKAALPQARVEILATTGHGVLASSEFDLHSAIVR